MTLRHLRACLIGVVLLACGDSVSPGRAGDPAGSGLDAERVPELLRPLLPLAEAWTLDDVDRAERIEGLSHAERQTLVARVDPHLDAIDAWVDSSDPAAMSEEVAAFFWLRLAVEEMRYD